MRSSKTNNKYLSIDLYTHSILFQLKFYDFPRKIILPIWTRRRCKFSRINLNNLRSIYQLPQLSYQRLSIFNLGKQLQFEKHGWSGEKTSLFHFIKITFNLWSTSSSEPMLLSLSPTKVTTLYEHSMSTIDSIILDRNNECECVYFPISNIIGSMFSSRSIWGKQIKP